VAPGPKKILGIAREGFESEVDDFEEEDDFNDELEPSGLPYELELSPADLDAYNRTKQRFLDDGYEDNASLHLLCVAILEMNRFRSLSLNEPQARKQFKDMTELASKLAHQLEQQKIQRAAGMSVPALFEKYMDDAKQYIEKHIGEFSFKCKSCGAVVTTDGLPHWAISWPTDEDGEITYFKWSPEVMRLYNEGVIPMHIAAYILRTSPMALIYTAEKRGEEIRECDREEEEKKLRELLERDRREYERERRQSGAV